MIAHTEGRYDTSLSVLDAPVYLDRDPHCEACDRSLITRFGGELPSCYCESCERDWCREFDRGVEIESS